MVLSSELLDGIFRCSEVLVAHHYSTTKLQTPFHSSNINLLYTAGSTLFPFVIFKICSFRTHGHSVSGHNNGPQMSTSCMTSTAKHILMAQHKVQNLSLARISLMRIIKVPWSPMMGWNADSYLAAQWKVQKHCSLSPELFEFLCHPQSTGITLLQNSTHISYTISTMVVGGFLTFHLIHSLLFILLMSGHLEQGIISSLGTMAV